ncbi:MAG: hypothetical protein K8E66_11105, partial [Phycisphaerales bacterium]|nr:hypothetical protein [Phycisphaerales bacterium]
EPLRRVLRGASKVGVNDALITPAKRAVDQFACLIRDDLGDRWALDAIVSAWVPEARREFELRSKQTAFKAMSQLKGARADAILATAIIHPSADAGRLDLVWLSGMSGLQRLRPGASVKLATRRMIPEDSDRRPLALDGEPVSGLHESVLEEFSSTPVPHIDVHHVGEAVHYTLGPRGFGPKHARDIVIAEINLSEMPSSIGKDEDRQAFFFAETSIPAKALQFDAIVHRDVYPGSDPRLRIYDTASEGVADVNDHGRDMDQLDVLESIEPLGATVQRIGSSNIPRYGSLIRHVFDRLHWDRGGFRIYRCRIDYPIYGSQITMCFDPPRRG